jgi:hypothetical protein
MDGSRVFIQDEFASVATNQALDGDEPIQMWDVANPSVPTYVDGIDLGSPLQPLVNPPHNMEIRYDLDVDGDGLPDRDRLYIGWYRGGLQAFDFTAAGFTARSLFHQVQTEGTDGVWDGAWAVRVERIGSNVYTLQSDRRYGLIVERVGTAAPIPDSDGDGPNDAADNCPTIVNGSQADGDGDALGDACEPNPYGTSASDADSDDDGCADGREVRTLAFTPAIGGDRDPVSGADFFDVPAPPLTSSAPGGAHDKAVSLIDVAAVLYYFGAIVEDPAEPNGNGAKYGTDWNANLVLDGAEYDRTASVLTGKPWRSGPPDGAVSLTDAAVALLQFGHDCTAPP